MQVADSELPTTKFDRRSWRKRDQYACVGIKSKILGFAYEAMKT